MSLHSPVGGLCATLNSHIEAEIPYRYKSGYLFEGCCFGTIMGSAKIK